MQEHTNAKEQDSKTRRSNPVHIVESGRIGPSSADALRDVHMSLVRAEQNLYNLVQASQAANGSLAQAGFGYAATQPFTSGYAPGFAPGFAPTASLHAPAGFGIPSTPWATPQTAMQTPTGIAYGVPNWAPLAPGLATPILAPGFASGFPSAAFAPAGLRTAPSSLIAADIADEGKQFVCQLDLPGLRADQVEILCFDNAVVVSAFREPETDAASLVQAERGTITQQRTLTLPHEILPAGVKASLNNGVLTIVLPKANPTEGPRRVKVQGS